MVRWGVVWWGMCGGVWGGWRCEGAKGRGGGVLCIKHTYAPNPNISTLPPTLAPSPATHTGTLPCHPHWHPPLPCTHTHTHTNRHAHTHIHTHTNTCMHAHTQHTHAHTHITNLCALQAHARSVLCPCLGLACPKHTHGSSCQVECRAHTQPTPTRLSAWPPPTRLSAGPPPTRLSVVRQPYL